MEFQPIAAVTPFTAEVLFPSWRGRTSIEPRLDAIGTRLWDAYPGLADAMAQLPFEQFEAAHPDLPVQRYADVPAAAAAYAAALPAAIRAPWLSALLLWHLRHFRPAFAASGLPDELAPHYIDAFHGILDRIDADPRFASLSSDAFLQSLWLARVVMIPALGQLWWPRAGLSAGAVLPRGVAAAAYVLLRCRGLRPFLEGYAHEGSAPAYRSDAGRCESLRLAALALRALPHLKGAFTTSHFNRAGAGGQAGIEGEGAPVRTLCESGVEADCEHSTSSSLPSNHMLIWSRGDLIGRHAT